MDGTKEIVGKIKFIKQSATELLATAKGEKEVIVESLKKEMTQVGLIIGMLVGGLLFLALGALLLIPLIILLIDLAVHRPWLSTLIVMVGLFAMGGGMAAYGIGKLKKIKKIVPESMSKFMKETPAGTKIEKQAVEIKQAADELKVAMQADMEARKVKAQAASENLKKAAPAILLGLVALKLLRRKKK